DEILTNPDLGVYLVERKPTLGEEASIFADVFQRVEGGRSVVSVAEVDGRIVGVCGIHPAGNHLEDRHVGELGIAVHPEHRGRRVGSALLDHALSASWTKFDRIVLTVLAINTRAIRMYERAGFQQCGTIPGSFRRGARSLDENVMWLGRESWRPRSQDLGPASSGNP
ncbi:MAG TPA: GNAT family N-acetyltransferase, partial [Thermoplasmata archaeon]|nr:GNAT family N-acetyltransferase [Thermoplasmata archaeon]